MLTEERISKSDSKEATLARKSLRSIFDRLNPESQFMSLKSPSLLIFFANLVLAETTEGTYSDCSEILSSTLFATSLSTLTALLARLGSLPATLSKISMPQNVTRTHTKQAPRKACKV